MSTREIARGGLLAAAATAWLYFGGVMPQIGPAACLIAGAASAIPLLRRANAAPQQKQPETLLLTAGGITLDQLTDSLESVQHPGIFFAGEALDVDGVCGGYNLQWAWSSGSAAGRAAAGEHA